MGFLPILGFPRNLVFSLVYCFQYGIKASNDETLDIGIGETQTETGAALVVAEELLH